MNRIFLSFAAVCCIVLSACHKSNNSGSSESFTQVETDVINDFVNKTAVPKYASLAAAGVTLDSTIQSLVANPNAATLQVAQANWRAMRVIWESSEGFLIGPVEANDYDPNSDTWPTDYHQMDSLLLPTTPNALTVEDIEALPQTLRGYHPIEYLIFGVGGTRTAGDLDARKKQYLSSLATDLKNIVTSLDSTWTSAAVPYAQACLKAGSGSTVYTTKQAFFLDITQDNGMAGICNEVGEPDEDGKMYNPYIHQDSSLTESPYSGNSLADFKNNIIGAQQVYLGVNGGKGMKDLVAAKNTSLDNQIQTAFTTAINSFDNISGTDDMRFEEAIFYRRTQIAATLKALNDLQSLLDNNLVSFIKTYVKD